LKSNIYGFQEYNKTKLNSNISVAMCTYNGELFLPEQLESIARQTVLPNELIICDDNSTDATLRILKDFQEKSPFNLKIYRIKIRQEIHEIQRWKRFYWVFKELLNNRYHRFSNGWKSAVKDLLL